MGRAVAALAPVAALAALPAAHALSRAAAVAALTALPTAGETGLGASYVLALSRRRALAGAAAGLAVALALLGVAGLWAAAAAGLAAVARDGWPSAIGGLAATCSALSSSSVRSRRCWWRWP